MFECLIKLNPNHGIANVTDRNVSKQRRREAQVRLDDSWPKIPSPGTTSTTYPLAFSLSSELERKAAFSSISKPSPSPFSDPDFSSPSSPSTASSIIAPCSRNMSQVLSATAVFSLDAIALTICPSCFECKVRRKERSRKLERTLRGHSGGIIDRTCYRNI